ncbi:MAG: hypothetical protein V7785_08195 [Bermanella sp.]
MLPVISSFLLSGCIDLSDSDSSSNSDTGTDPDTTPETEAGSEFFGAWKTNCSSSELEILTISNNLIAMKAYTFENTECTGTGVEAVAIDYGVSYGEKVMVGSGVEATQVVITDFVSTELIAFELMYRDGDNLYFGGDSETEVSWPTDIDYNYEIILQ